MALGASTFTLAGTAVSDLFQSDAYGLKADADRLKAQGQRLEAGLYKESAGFARQNVQFNETSTAIKEAQLSRSILTTLGGQRADIAAAGFADSGSALDLMRDSAAQGALTKAVAGQQGLIEQAGFEQQAKSYDVMSQASELSARQSDLAAESDDAMQSNMNIMAAIHGAAAIGTLFTGGGEAGGEIAKMFAGGGG